MKKISKDFIEMIDGLGYRWENSSNKKGFCIYFKEGEGILDMFANFVSEGINSSCSDWIYERIGDFPDMMRCGIIVHTWYVYFPDYNY